MDKTIIFQLRPYNITASWIQRAYLGKFNRKIKAKIFEYTNSKFRVEINGLSWDKANLNECKNQVIENYSTFLVAINKSVKIVIQ